MSARLIRRLALAVATIAVLAGAGRAVFGSAATLPVAPKNYTAFRTCALTAYPKTTAVSFDGWVDQANVGANKVGSTTIQIQSRATGKNYRGFIRFDLTKCVPAIAGSATVRAAFLRLNLSGPPTSGPRTYNVNRVVGPCPENATTCWTEAGLTWSNQPPVAAAATSTLTLTSTSTSSVYYAFDVTTDVAAFVAGTASNYGWRMSDSAEDSAGTILVSFIARELNSAARAPELVVVYSP
jgi:hypothetical protein